MDIIVTHNITDLDGLSAMIAAAKLHKDARPVFVGRLHRMVRNFMALYRDEFQVARLEDIDLDSVERVIIVDTYDINRLGSLTQKIDWDRDDLEIIVYDHHPHKPEDVPRVDLDLSQTVGSATTILVNKIKAENINLNPLEATLCALGIYADTGKFTHLDTTPDDLQALAFLLRARANMKIINEFLVDKLNSSQREIYKLLQDNREQMFIEGVEVNLLTLEYDQYVAGLNNVVEKLKLLLSVTVIFVLVEMDGDTFLISRSSDEAVDVGRICSHLGGGGHSGAASARLKMKLTAAREKLVSLLNSEIKPVTSVGDIMTTDVRTITPETTIARAEKIMNRYGHNGLIVCDQGQIAGVFSRRDIDKVKGHDLMHAPVKAYMSKNVIKIEQKAPVSRARSLMVKYDIGRLPVIKDEQLQGIVTRSDIINSYYDELNAPFKYQNIYGNSLVEINPVISNIESRVETLPQEVRQLLEITGKIGKRLDCEVYLVGGMVRDLLLGRPNNDLDFVVEGDVEQLVISLARELEGEWTFNEKFETANIRLENYNLDFAATRKEYYPAPGALPEVEQADILADLFRRDYTVNALALNVSPQASGKLLDFFNGQRDLEEKRLKILHRFSFLDDPTRIIRGVRLALALDFSFEKETAELAREALAGGDFSGLSLTRVFREIRLLFAHSLEERLVYLLQKYDLFELLEFEPEPGPVLQSELERLEDFLDRLAAEEYILENWLVRLRVLTGGFPRSLCDKLNLSSLEEEVLCGELAELSLLEAEKSLVERVEILEKMAQENIVLCWFYTRKQGLKNDIENYFTEIKKIDVKINGNQLQEMGLEEGPKIREVLEKIRRAHITGELENKQEEQELARRLISNKDENNNQ